MAVFAPLDVAPSFVGWGPPPGADEAVGPEFSLQHLDKFSPTAHQQWGRICDFTVSGMKFQEQRLAKGKGKGKFGKQILMPKKPTDEEGFDIVDSRKLPVKGAKGGGKGGKAKGGKVAMNYQEGILGQKTKQVFQMNNGKGKGKGKKGFGNRGRGMPSFKEWSVQTKSEWEMKREIMLSALAKAQVDSRQVEQEDLTWCGDLRQYDKAFDRIMVRTEKPMSRYESLSFFNVTTSEDPYLPEYMSNDPSVTVIATDHVLASLIAAARSVYSWDVVVTKIQGRLIFDKRDGSSLDFLTVNETAQDPPNNDDPNDKNAPQKLGQEASCINQNFSQMVLDSRGDAEVMENSNPFEDEDEPEATASGAYRYRKITLPGNPKDENPFGQQAVTMVVRTEVNCKLGDSYVSTKILNEYEPKATYSWRLHLETQRGAVLATELKNNAFKMGRWAAQAMLSGCDVLKLGYASRVNPKDPWSHTLLGVQTHYTENFADQIGISRNNAFGILRSIIDILMDWEDGKYLILKDPTKSVMRFYEVPADCFDEEEEEEEEPEEEGPDLDEDGNVKPERPVGPMVVSRVGRM